MSKWLQYWWNNGSNCMLPSKTCTVMKMCASGVILDGVLDTLNASCVHSHMSIVTRLTLYGGVSLQCARSAHATCTQRKNIASVSFPCSIDATHGTCLA